MEWSAGIFLLPEAVFSLEARWWDKKIKVVQMDPCHSFSLHNSPSVEVIITDQGLTPHPGCLSVVETHSFTEQLDFTFRKNIYLEKISLYEFYPLALTFDFWV